MIKNISSEIETLENKLKKLKAEEVKALRKELRAAKKRVTALKGKIAKITGEAVRGVRRKRMSDEDKMSVVSKELSKNPNGLSQIELSKETGIPYPSLAVFLKEHQKEFNFTGKRKSKRYFLK